MSQQSNAVPSASASVSSAHATAAFFLLVPNSCARVQAQPARTIRCRPVRDLTRHDRMGRGDAPAGSNPVRRIGAGGRKKSAVVVIGFMSAVTPIDNDYGQEDLVAVVRIDLEANAAHDFFDILDQRPAALAEQVDMRVARAAEVDDDGPRHAHSAGLVFLGAITTKSGSSRRYSRTTGTISAALSTPSSARRRSTAAWICTVSGPSPRLSR